MNPCRVCSEKTSKICTGCKTVAYCSVECQKIDWLFHKVHCKKPTEGSVPKVSRYTYSRASEELTMAGVLATTKEGYDKARRNVYEKFQHTSGTTECKER